MDFDDIIKPIPTDNFKGTDDKKGMEGAFIDADTLKNISTGQGYRLKNFDAPEVWSLQEGVFTPGEVGAQELTAQTAILAKHYGFNNLVNTGEDSYNRKVTDLQDDLGRSWSDFVIEERLAGANEYTEKSTIDNRMLNSFVDSLNVIDQTTDPAARARLAVNNAIQGVEGYSPTWGQEASSEAEYAMGEGMYSRESSNNIAELLANESDPAKRQELQEALFYSKWGKNPFTHVGSRKNDRSITNDSYFQTTTSLELGLENAVQAFYGVGELTGESTGWDWLKAKSTAGISRSEDVVSDKADVLSSYNDIEGVGDAFTWVVNNATMSLPLMGAVIAGGVVAAPLGLTGTAGVIAAATPSAVLSTGSIWNSMPDGEKSAGLAVLGGYSVGLLDRLGFTGGIPGLMSSSTKSAVERGALKDVFKELNGKVFNRLVADGATPANAAARLANASKSQLVQMSDKFGQMASGQLRDLKLVKGSINRIVTSIGREAATEVVQTAIEEVAAVYGTSAELNPAAFKEALITSAVVGGVFGAGFDMPSIAKQHLDRKSILQDVSNSTKTLSDIESISREDQEAAQAAGKTDRTNDDNIAEINKNGTANGTPLNFFEEASKRGRTSREAESTVGRMMRAVKRTPGAPFVAHLTNMIDKIGLRDPNGNRNRTVTMLASLLGGVNINSGAHHQEYIQLLRGRLVDSLPTVDSVAAQLGTNTRTANKLIRNAVDNYISKGREYDGPKAVEVNAVLDRYRDGQAQVKALLREEGMMDEYNSLSDGGLDIISVRPLDQDAINSDREGFKKRLMELESDYGKMGSDSADDYINRILSGDGAAAAVELNQTYSASNGALSPYMSRNVISSYRSDLESTARRAGNLKYLGENNSVLSAALAAIKAEGATDAQVDELAADIQDYLEISTGDYGAWKSPWIKSVQDNLILVTFLRGMGFSAIASLPEGPLTQLGVPEHIAFKHVSTHAKTSAKSMLDYMNFLSSNIPGSPIPRHIFDEQGIDQLNKLGYQSGHSSAVKQMGIEIEGWQQKIAETYAKAVGLNNITDTTRAVRASMAADVIRHYADILAVDPAAETNMGREAYKELRSLGVDVGFMVGVHQKAMENPDLRMTPEAEAIEFAKLKSELEMGTLRFIDQAIVNPMPGQIPKGYKHQKFAVFNQFQGFIANFTAKILPRIMKQVVHGSAGVSAGAVSVSMGMVAAAFLGTIMRDMLKYGEPTPYLDDYDKFRRVLFSSGLLGSGERVWSAIDPLYGAGIFQPGQDATLGSTIGNTASGVLGEAAAWGVVEDIAGGAYEGISGEGEKAAKHALKLTPIVGSVNQLRDNIIDSLF